MPQVLPSPTPLFDIYQAGGGVTQLAASLGITESAVSQWRIRNRVPIRASVAVAAATGIPVWEIAPEIYSPQALDEALSAHKQHASRGW